MAPDTRAITRPVTEVWTNWARQQRCAPVRIVRPASEEELAGAVATAAGEGLAVRVVGSGHSFTDTACTDGYLSSSTPWTGSSTPTATGPGHGQAGITLHELGQRRPSWGWRWRTRATSTPRRWPGRSRPPPTAPARATEHLVSGRSGAAGHRDGRRADVGGDDPEPRAPPASAGRARRHRTVTLRTCRFHARRVDDPLPLGEVLDGFDGSRRRRPLRAVRVPLHRPALTRTSTRSGREPSPATSGSRWSRTAGRERRDGGAGAVTAAPAAGDPAAGPDPGQGPARGKWTAATASTPLRREVSFTEMEYAIPREHGPEALRAGAGGHRAPRLPIAFPIEVRCPPATTRPCQPPTAATRVHRRAPFRGQEFETYFRAVEAIMDSYGGRPTGASATTSRRPR